MTVRRGRPPGVAARPAPPWAKLPAAPLFTEAERQGVEVAELARRAGVELRTVRRWKAAGALPPASADVLAVALGVHPMALYGDEWLEVLLQPWRGDRTARRALSAA